MSRESPAHTEELEKGGGIVRMLSVGVVSIHGVRILDPETHSMREG